jgi:elongation factor P
MVHAKLRKLRSGVTIEHRFRASDTIDEARLETHDLQFMYRGGETFHFMNTETYEQLEMDEEALGDAAPWMVEGTQVIAEYYDGRPIAVDLPKPPRSRWWRHPPSCAAPRRPRPTSPPSSPTA